MASFQSGQSKVLVNHGVGPEPAWDAVAITPADSVLATPVRFLFVGSGGGLLLKIKTLSGNDLTFTNVQDGTYIWCGATQVYTTGTTVSNIIGFY